MIASRFTAGFRKVAGAFAAFAMVFSATPALANSSATADIAAPLRAAQEARPSATGDDQFRQLFASWRSLEKTSVPALAAVGDAADAANRSARRTTTLAPSFALSPVRAVVSSIAIPSRMPVEDVRMSSDFGMRTHPVLGGRRGHKGVDLAGPIGTPIHATADGIVGRAEWFSSYGLYVQLEHGGDIETRYGHMSRLNVAAGQRVRKGDVIGFIGSTGRSTGPHLHYEVRIAGNAVNPVPYMQGDYLRRAGGSN